MLSPMGSTLCIVVHGSTYYVPVHKITQLVVAMLLVHAERMSAATGG